MSSGAIHAAVGDAVANALTPTNPACSDGAGTPPEPNTAQDPLPSELPASDGELISSESINGYLGETPLSAGTDDTPTGAASTSGVYGGAPGSMIGQRRPPIRAPLVRPRKVRGGVKVPNGDVAPANAWVAQRWLRLMEQAAPGQRLSEGLEDYARAGQTKKLSFMLGRVDGVIQGRADRPYGTSIAFDTFSAETWDKVVETMAEGSLYAAKLLASELPPNIEDVFAPLGLKLFPGDGPEVRHACSCFEWRTENGGNPNVLSGGKWCKHVCCLGYLIAQRLAAEQFVVFLLRGIEGSELLERLRQRRVVAGAALGLIPIYSQRVPGVAELEGEPLESSLAQFWDAGPTLQDLDLPLGPPPVSHPLLRRLGQSPFLNAQFPLVGLLASCYDTVSEQTAKIVDVPAELEPESIVPTDDDEGGFD